MPDPELSLIPASWFSLDDLTAAYNQSRTDYLIPMQMDAAHLADYFHIYDVDLDRSWVALAGETVLGLAMLGVRPGRAWVTRLGVLPNRRRGGTGAALVNALLANALALPPAAPGEPRAILEVIKGNTPAQDLFTRLGFQVTRELLVLRRPAGPPARPPSGTAAWLDAGAALALLRGCPQPLPWTNQPETYRNGGDAAGLRVALAGGGRGWLVFRRQPGELSHFVFNTEAGDPLQVGLALLDQLCGRFPDLPWYLENIPADDPHLAALLETGTRETFRRREMAWDGVLRA